jgi:hypothetical protein
MKIYYNPVGFSLANTPRQSVALPPLSRGDLKKWLMSVCQPLKFYFKSSSVFVQLKNPRKRIFQLHAVVFRCVRLSPSWREYPEGGREVKASLQKLAQIFTAVAILDPPFQRGWLGEPGDFNKN